MEKTLRIADKLYLSGINDAVTKTIQTDLTVTNPKYTEAVKYGRSVWNIPEVIKSFTVSPDGEWYKLPRGYLEQLLTILDDTYIIKDERVSVPVQEYPHNIQLRDYQYDALNTMGRFTEGVLVAPAGSGKTIMGLALILMARQKALWLTHTHNLANQFIDRYKQFITGEEVGLIGAGKRVIGKHVTVGLVQTLARDDNYLNTIKDEFGIVIVDEAHHVPATTFTNVLQFSAAFIYGLTATPERKDKLETLLYHTVGPIRHIIGRDIVLKNIITPTVLAIRLHTGNYQNIQEYQKLIETLVFDDKRNEIIIQYIISEAMQGNICIVTTDRRAHADLLYTKLQERGASVCIATGNYTLKHRKEVIRAFENMEFRVLVCTTSLLGEGFDNPIMNRLFITLPFRNAVKCEQLVGRVQRVAEGKKDAIIYDFVDTSNGVLKHQYRNNRGICRYKIYKKLGCEIKEL